MTPSSEESYALLVDDDQSVLSALAMLLAALGWKTLRSTSAEDALNQIGKRQFRVAIIDFNMPKMNGFELCRTIRAQAESEGLTIFLHSGYIEPKYMAAMESSGANAVIWKPAGLAEIKEVFLKHSLPFKGQPG